MRKSYFITGAALVAAFTIGCFAVSAQQSSPPQTKKNLGVVIFTNGIPRYFSLGDAKSCTATAKHATNGIEVDFSIQQTNSDGTVYPLGEPRLIDVTGSYCDITSGSVTIKLKPMLKTR
jgi:Flp pilus assembly secretin CpaC